MQLSEQRHQKGSFSATGGSDDQINFALLEDHFILDPQVEVSTRRTGSDGSRRFGGPRERSVADADERGVTRHIRSDGVLFLGGVKRVEKLGLRRGA